MEPSQEGALGWGRGRGGTKSWFSQVTAKTRGGEAGEGPFKGQTLCLSGAGKRPQRRSCPRRSVPCGQARASSHTCTRTHLLTRAAWWSRGLLTHRGQRLLPRSPVHLLHPESDRAAMRLQGAEGPACLSPGEGPAPGWGRGHGDFEEDGVPLPLSAGHGITSPQPKPHL